MSNKNYVTKPILRRLVYNLRGKEKNGRMSTNLTAYINTITVNNKCEVEYF